MYVITDLQFVLAFCPILNKSYIYYMLNISVSDISLHIILNFPVQTPVSTFEYPTPTIFH